MMTVPSSLSERASGADGGPVLLGLMTPLTGLVRIYGQEIALAARMAVEEVNEQGGVLGRPLQLVVEDDGSLPDSAVRAAHRLIDQYGCAAMIGNLLSNSRIAVAYWVAEPRRIPMLNFSFYEGSILSRYFFHFAALPNQQIDRMIPYMKEHHGGRMFFAGNNYEWPRGSIAAARQPLLDVGGEVVGEEYLPIGVSDAEIDQLLQQLAGSGAQVFVPYFAGADQLKLLTRFSASGLKSRMAVVMGHYDEAMARALPPEVREGLFSSNTYFMSLDTPENRRHMERLAARPEIHGLWPPGDGLLTNFGEGALVCVKAFAQAANRAGSLAPEALIKALESSEIVAPQGTVRMDPVTHHARVNTFLARCDREGRFIIVERFGAIDPVMPERYRHLRIDDAPAREEDIRLQSRMLEHMSEGVCLVRTTDGAIVYTNNGFDTMFGVRRGEMFGRSLRRPGTEGSPPPFVITGEIARHLFHKGRWEGEISTTTVNGVPLWCFATFSCLTHAEHGEVWMVVLLDITARKEMARELKKLEWLLQPKFFAPEAFTPLYGDVTRLNTCRTILDAVGAENLHSIMSEFMGMLETSSAVYEVNGDYAAGIFSSGWCQFMDGASFRLCGTDDTAQALACGRWVCHDSCWKEASLPAIQSGRPNDIECGGGIHLYAVPIRAGEEIVGSINFGYGNPPREEQKLLELSRTYQVELVELKQAAASYQERPPFVIELAKRRLVEAANLIGLLVTRKRDALRLQQLNQELEQRVQERTSELSVANRELESFAYAVSHDLRAPLRAISGFSQALIEDYGASIPQEGQHYLNIVQQSSREMGELIDGLLRLSRVTRDEMQRERVDLTALAKKVIQTLRQTEPERRVEVHVAHGLMVHGDAQLLHVVLENLLGNAWKYTARTPDARIALSMERHEGRGIYRVTDNGAGFDMRYADKLFTPFQRLHNSGEYPGHGIGLATVQRIIQRHGGTIWAVSEVGQGATFFFTIPEPGE